MGRLLEFHTPWVQQSKAVTLLLAGLVTGFLSGPGIRGGGRKEFLDRQRRLINEDIPTLPAQG